MQKDLLAMAQTLEKHAERLRALARVEVAEQVPLAVVENESPAERKARLNRERCARYRASKARRAHVASASQSASQRVAERVESASEARRSASFCASQRVAGGGGKGGVGLSGIPSDSQGEGISDSENAHSALFPDDEARASQRVATCASRHARRSASRDMQRVADAIFEHIDARGSDDSRRAASLSMANGLKKSAKGWEGCPWDEVALASWLVAVGERERLRERGENMGRGRMLRYAKGVARGAQEAQELPDPDMRGSIERSREAASEPAWKAKQRKALAAFEADREQA